MLFHPVKFISKYSNKKAWNKYLKKQEAVIFSQKNPKNIDEAFFQRLCVKLIPFLDTKFPHIDKKSTKKSVLIETRVLPHTEFVIKNTIQKLGNGWAHMVFCSKENLKQITAICGTISPSIEIVVLENNITTKDGYNNLLLSSDFWNKISGDKILIYQTDTFVFRAFDKKFLEWDYIGAPWQGLLAVFNDLPDMKIVGNGGLSLRSTNKIKKIVQQESLIKNTSGYPSNHLPEDIYFSYHLQKKGARVPSVEEARTFSFEYPTTTENYIQTIENAFGSHQPWHSLDKSEFSNFIKTNFDFSSLVHVYVITWENSKNLEYFINYYRDRFPKCAITIYDNASTDDTGDVARKYNCELISFQTDGLDDVKNRDIKNSCWKGQKEKWAFCLDDDELLDLTVVDLLTEEADVISFAGVERYNREKHLINSEYNKSVAFKVANITETNFDAGAHNIEPVSKKKLVTTSGKYYLIHDKYSSQDMIYRNRVLNSRVIPTNKEKGWSWHYDTDVEGYYNFGLQNGVTYEYLDKAPSVSYADFKMNHLEHLPENFNWEVYHEMWNDVPADRAGAMRHYLNIGRFANLKHTVQDLNSRFAALYNQLKDVSFLPAEVFTMLSAKYPTTNLLEDDKAEIALLDRLYGRIIDIFSKTTPIYVFYHIYAENDWEAIVDEQLAMIYSTGVFFHADKMFVNVLGTDADYEKVKAKFKDKEKVFVTKSSEPYEFSTLEMIQDYSGRENFKGLYIHTKSSSVPVNHPEKKSRSFWRIWMNYFTLKYWKCNYTLLDYFDVVGVNYKDGNVSSDEYWEKYSTLPTFEGSWWHTGHFAGNFWWFNSSYIKGIKRLRPEEKVNRFNAEWFVFRNNPKYFNWTTNNMINHQMRDRYIDAITGIVTTTKQRIIFPESKLAHKYLDGLLGIEIGPATHNPFNIPNCKFVDKYESLDTEWKMLEQNFSGDVLVPDIIAEGNQLPFEDNSLDYVITSHVMEHFYDTIGVMKEWVRVVRPGGYIVTIFPHKERTFDKDRPRTTLAELIERHKEGVIIAPDKHHTVWVTEDAVEFCNYLGLNVVECLDVDDKVGNGFMFIVKV